MAMQICSVLGRGSYKQVPLFMHMTKANKHSGTRMAVDSAKYSATNTTHQLYAKELHASAKVQYPEAKQIPLPNNVDEIDNSKLACFSPNRARDMLGSVINSQTSSVGETYAAANHHSSSDPHVGSYDCTGAVSLNSAMQSNVPEPFSSVGKSTHLNMPGGQWGQGQKYIAEDLQNSHYSMVPRQEIDRKVE